MVASNNRGQILIEVCLVMSLVIVITFAALHRLADLKNRPRQFQLTEDGKHAHKSFQSYKK